MTKFFPKLLVLLIILSLISCKQEDKETFNEEDYKTSMQEWKTKRLEALKSEEGWLNLVGLHWINEGINIFGSSEDNDIIFPEHAPNQIGAIIKFKGSLSISINDSIEVSVNDTLIIDYDIKTDADSDPTIFKMGRYNWHIIKRNEKYAVRLRDLESPIINELKEIPTFPVDLNWRIEAIFERFAIPIEIEVGNVLGTTDIETCYGSLNFKFNEKEYELLPLGEGIKENLFLIFGDETSAKETYGGGRYLSVEKPDSTGKTIIDFNKATNPPCAFTEYATCPLPPKENILNFGITAGEKNVDIGNVHKNKEKEEN